jgi:hypothetical protein
MYTSAENGRFPHSQLNFVRRIVFSGREVQKLGAGNKVQKDVAEMSFCTVQSGL